MSRHVAEWHGLTTQGRRGMSGPGAARAGWAWLGEAFAAGVARRGFAWLDEVRRGLAGIPPQRKARQARRGMAGNDDAGLGAARLCKAGWARRVLASCGQSGSGEAITWLVYVAGILGSKRCPQLFFRLSPR